MRSFLTVASALAVAVPLSQAQTFTDCDPTKKTCPANPGLAVSEYTADFTTGLPADWTATTGSISATAQGGEFKIEKVGEGPTVQSNFHIFYGYVEITMKAAPGAGIVSSLVLQSSDLDEIDWEWIGSDKTQAQSNYFGKGNTTTYDRGAYHPVSAPQDSFHTYAVDWKEDTTTWLIDGVAIRTLKYADANGGKNYPQTPMNIRIGNWVAGTPGNSQGTIDWAGGLTDFSQAPFSMYVSKLTIKNYNPGSSYTYSDNSGSSSSIKIDGSTGSSGAVASNSTTGTTTGAAAGAGATGSVVTKVATSYVTTCPVGQTITGANGATTVLTTPHASTVFTTLTSTICTVCSTKATGAVSVPTTLASTVVAPTAVPAVSTFSVGTGTNTTRATGTSAPASTSSTVTFQGAASSFGASGYMIAAAFAVAITLF